MKGSARNHRSGHLRCGFSCAWARIRCPADLLSANSLASFRQDQCVLPSPGGCCTRRITRLRPAL